MSTSYAVSWRNGAARQATGRAELGGEALLLVGTAEGETVRDEIPYRDLTSIAVGRAPADRMNGRPTLVLGRVHRGPLRLAGIAQPWIVSELADRLALLVAAAEASGAAGR